MQIITKDGKVKCTAIVHYPPEIVAQMKKAGYRVKEAADELRTAERRRPAERI